VRVVTVDLFSGNVVKYVVPQDCSLVGFQGMVGVVSSNPTLTWLDTFNQTSDLIDDEFKLIFDGLGNSVVRFINLAFPLFMGQVIYIAPAPNYTPYSVQLFFEP
jgi:hypothetical protein